MTCLLPGCANAPAPGKKVCLGCWAKVPEYEQHSIRDLLAEEGEESATAALVAAVQEADRRARIARGELTEAEREERSADCVRWANASGEERWRLKREYEAKWRGR